MGSENHTDNHTDNDSYEFISETIKKRPVNKRRAALKLLFTTFSGVVFGVVACLTYVLVLPSVQKHFSTPELNQIKLSFPGEEQVTVQEVTPKEEQGSAEPKEEAKVTADSGSNSPSTEAKEDPTEEEPLYSEPKEDQDETGKEENSKTTLGDIPEGNEKAKGVKAEAEEEKAEDLQEDIRDVSESLLSVSGELTEAGSDPMQRQFEIDDYTLLYQKLSEVAEEVSRSLVTVTGVSSDNDWFSSKYEKGNVTSGLILADNGKELLILARTSTVKDADTIEVTFCDGEKLPGTLRKSDSNTGLCVVAVELEQISETTASKFKMGELGNSRIWDMKGKPVIAVGDPLGVSDSVAIGQITSNSILVDKADSNVSILTTDIYGASTGSGVLCDFDGKILGIICHDGSTSDTKNLVRAYSISDIRATIEKILNGQDIAYLGIQGTDVTDEISDLYDIPKGAYVKQVVPDSPAMKAGIQNGDVIVKLGTNNISSFADFREAMLKSQPKDTTTVTIMRLGREEYVEISYEVILGML